MNTKKYIENTYTDDSVKLHYYEIKNNLPALVMIHAQGVCALSYDNVFKELSKSYHIFSIDCYGHGYSSHNIKEYNIKAIGDAIIKFIKNIIHEKVHLTGHSSGGLIATYIAAYSDVCKELYLEDPPLFSSEGDRRFQTFNYIDLSTVCYRFINQKIISDFVLYYFEHQMMWGFFPEKSREKIKHNMIKIARRYRGKHLDKDLKIPFWPKAALCGYKGMNQYDPCFGETFYNNTFHAGIKHEEILKKIHCKTTIMKAKTNFSNDNILLAAMSDEDADYAHKLIPESKVVYFDCGHGIHIEKKKEFLMCFLE